MAEGNISFNKQEKSFFIILAILLSPIVEISVGVSFIEVEELFILINYIPFINLKPY